MAFTVARWLAGRGEQVLSEIGIRTGQVVLDFGCGRGLYALAAAALVGPAGRVYALDHNSRILRQLQQEAEKRRALNIVTAGSLTEVRAGLGSRRLDVILLYDVLHHIYFTEKQRATLLRALSGLLAAGGLISIFPRHMEEAEIWRLREEMADLGLRPAVRLAVGLLHDGAYERGVVLNFRSAGPVAAAG
jgi:2-polyprenyl-3-methyl-5-hydroxy-6-metoxy-1,4-benzoquinol methylase